MTAVQISAQDLFQAAYENRYTWDPQFPGYSADITYTQDGKVFTGQARVSSDLKAEVLNVEDEEAQKAIHGQLWETSIHRVRRSFEDTHSKNTFSYGKTDETGAVEILMGGKAEGDYYKLRNNEVCLVHRHIHGVVVTINTFSSQDTGEGYLSHRYDSVYHDPQTQAQKGGKSLFEDTYEKIGAYWILNHRAIQTEAENGTVTQDFVFSNIQLL
jgi:GNAT superfamily N-acetyltransferase